MQHMQSPTAKLRVGLFAEAFGFGPASKAVTVARGCAQKFEIEFVVYATSVARSYFEKEGFKAVQEADIFGASNDLDIEAIADGLDVAIVSVQPEWAEALHGKVPTLYLDSLGFMWNEKFFASHPRLRDVDAYVAQDFFGAADNLRAHGVRNLIPCGAIIGGAARGTRSGEGRIGHLGGLINIFSSSDGIHYARFALRLLDGLVDEVLLSQVAVDALAGSSVMRLRCIPSEMTLERFAQSRSVITSPGLTALLELAALGVPASPLPPQNYSQALMVARLARLVPEDPLWDMLAIAYRIPAGMGEEQGVALVRELNRANAADASFIDRYRTLLRSHPGRPLPRELSSEGGVETCVSTFGRLARARSRADTLRGAQ